jgi:lipopolysaccharide export system protein LptA
VSARALRTGLVLLLGLGGAPGAGAAEEPPFVEAVTAPASGETPAKNPTERGSASAAQLGFQLQPGEDVRIDADELALMRLDDGNGERLVFRKRVTLTQGDLSMSCQELEAYYPQGTQGRMQRIEARGGVDIKQGDTSLRCGSATYQAERCEMICGSDAKPALLQRGCDVLRGRQITFNTCTGAIGVDGAARLEVQVDEAPACPPEP